MTRGRCGLRWMLALLLTMAAALPLCAQRRVNPVVNASKETIGRNDNRQRTDSIARSTLAHFHDEMGNIILVDTLTGMEVRDTIPMQPHQGIPKMIQPLLYSASVGVDIWDPVMRLFGQKYGLIEFSGEVNLHNRYIPVVEVGLGRTNHTPAGNNYTFRVSLTPYFRLGMNYNFIYNSNPDYMAYAGVRFGFSHFTWHVDDVDVSSSYWHDPYHGDFPAQTSNVTYFQFLFGLRVKLYGPISAGWSLRLRTRLHETKGSNGKPWYIPGYGARKGAMAGSFSIFYTFQLGQNLWKPTVKSKAKKPPQAQE